MFKQVLLIASSWFLGLYALQTYATQISASGYAKYFTPTTTLDNNLTVLSAEGDSFVRGGNDVVMSWDGTLFTSSSDYTGPGGAYNMTLSATAILGQLWIMHDIQVFRPGTYTFDGNLGGDLGEGFQTLSVGSGQLGAHMLVNWGTMHNLDVLIVWNPDGVFGDNSVQRTFTGSQIWSSVSIDGDHDGVPGFAMVGALSGLSPNFNLKGISPIPEPAPLWLIASGLIAMFTTLSIRHHSRSYVHEN